MARGNAHRVFRLVPACGGRSRAAEGRRRGTGRDARLRARLVPHLRRSGFVARISPPLPRVLGLFRAYGARVGVGTVATRIPTRRRRGGQKRSEILLALRADQAWTRVSPVRAKGDGRGGGCALARVICWAILLGRLWSWNVVTGGVRRALKAGRGSTAAHYSRLYILEYQSFIRQTAHKQDGARVTRNRKYIHAQKLCGGPKRWGNCGSGRAREWQRRTWS